jgi:hypothetical protein
MSLITEISAFIPAMYPSATFVLSSKFRANLQSFDVTSAKMPLIILDNELPKDNTVGANDNVQKDSRIVISVLFLDNLENTDLQSETLRANAEIIADSLAVQIYQLASVKPKPRQNYKVTPLFHVYNSNMTGVSLEMQVNYNEVVNFSITV